MVDVLKAGNFTPYVEYFPNHSKHLERELPPTFQPTITRGKQMNNTDDYLNSKALSTFFDLETLESIDEGTLQDLLGRIKRKTFDPGSKIISEGEQGNSFYIIDQGTVEVIKESETNRVIGDLKEGDIFGELALLTGKPRAAAVQAKDQTVIFELQKDDFEYILQHYPKVNGKILKSLYDRLKTSYHNLEVKKEEVDASYQKQIELGFLFTSVIFIISLYTFFIGIFNIDFDHPYAQTIVYVSSRSLELLVLLVFVAIVIKSSVPLTGFGVTIKGWKKSLKESIIVTIPFMLAMTGGKLLLMEYTELFSDTALLNWHYFDWSYITYLAVAPLQEFVTRGVFQSSIQRLLISRYDWLLAISITSLVFGALHLHSSVALGLAAFATSWLWGLLFARHKTLVGVSVSHFLIGNWSGLLGFWLFF